MDLDITCAGKIVSADEIQFKRVVADKGGVAMEEFTAKREKKKM
jgi:aminoglycoside N3'-acetyltransferase